MSGAPFYMWKLGHMDGPHTSSRGLGISRDGKFAVGTTLVVNRQKAWRTDNDWLIGTDDGVPPLENELFVQQAVGIGVATCSSDLAFAGGTDTYNLDKDYPLICPWGGSKVAGQIMEGTNPRLALLWNENEVCDPDDPSDPVLSYLTPDFGGGLSQIIAKDISSNGDTMIGYGYTNKGKEGFIANDLYMYTPTADPTDNEFVLFRNGTTTFKKRQYEACSEDGTIFVGYGTKTRNGDNVAFVSRVLSYDDTLTTYTIPKVELETVELPPLAGSPGPVEAYAISNDGTVVGGTSNGKPVIWFQEVGASTWVEGWVVKDIGTCQPGHPFSNAKVTGIIATPGGAAGDYMAIGTATTSFEPQEAFIWKGNANSDVVVCPDYDATHGEALYRLEYVLTHTGAGEASSAGSDWVYTAANGIAIGFDHMNEPDNIRILGSGINPEGGEEAFLMDGVTYGNYVFEH